MFQSLIAAGLCSGLSLYIFNGAFTYSKVGKKNLTLEKLYKHSSLIIGTVKRLLSSS